MTSDSGYPEASAPVEEHERSLRAVEELLGYRFSDRRLLLQALCHKSYANERGWPPLTANERLEFLGDSVVELAVTHMLFEDFPRCTEGELTKLRAPIVRGRALARIAEKMGLGQHVLLGKGEEVTGGRRKQSILANSFEAVVGAIYLDGGFDVARGLVISCLEDVVRDIVRRGAGDHKSELQELAARNAGAVPRYTVTHEGPDHYRTYHAVVEVGGNRFGPVTGSSKKQAEQGAARMALVQLGWAANDDERPDEDYGY